MVLNNGSILKAGVRNIECFDLSKHITGSLKQNLNELNCSVQKGEFDYELGNDWDKMSREHQDDCIQYLRGDVVGLKELSERLNKECFEKFGVNLYKYLSTSQLTYSIWVNRLYAQHKKIQSKKCFSDSQSTVVERTSTRIVLKASKGMTISRGC